jgi:hypothetical protein
MLLPAFAFFTTVHTSFVSSVTGGFEPAAVYESRTGTYLPDSLFTNPVPMQLINLFDKAFILPLAVIIIYGIPGSKIGRLHAPLTTSPDRVDDSIKNGT